MSILIAFDIPYFCYIPHRVRAGGGGVGGRVSPFLNAQYRENLIIATEQMQWTSFTGICFQCIVQSEMKTACQRDNI